MTINKSKTQYVVKAAPIPCEQCGESFYPKAWGRKMRFCDVKCREAWWANKRRLSVPQVRCGVCERWFRPSSRQGKYCSHGCRREAHLLRIRDSWLRRHYGITLEDYAIRLTAQGGGCAICGTSDTSPHRYFSVDHDHGTGEVRGLLCNRCNVGIGRFGDDAILLQRAVQYLECDR